MQNIPPTNDEALEFYLSKCMSRRGGEHIIQPAYESSIDLHDIVCSIAPEDCLSLLAQSSAARPILHQEEDATWIQIALPFGEIRVYSKNHSHWSATQHAAQIAFDIHYAGLSVFDYQTINAINGRYDHLQLFSKERCGTLIARATICLNGGRSVENILWAFTHLYLEADRANKDLTIFR